MAQQALDLEGRLYTAQHEWVSVQGGVATIGITIYAQQQLGDVVYLQLPKPGAMLKQGGKLGEVESVKTVSDIFSPVTGRVIEVNQDLTLQPELVNQDAEGLGWLVKSTYEPNELGNLMTHSQYQQLIAAESHH